MFLVQYLNLLYCKVINRFNTEFEPLIYLPFKHFLKQYVYQELYSIALSLYFFIHVCVSYLFGIIKIMKPGLFVQ